MWRMDLKGAQGAFMTLFQQIPQVETQKAFLAWIGDRYMKGVPQISPFEPPMPVAIKSHIDSAYTYIPRAADDRLKHIANDLRKIVPLNAIFPSEKITFPSVGENSDCDPSHTLHVDAFLYDDDMIDELCDTGELARNFCVDCSSHNTQPITYISHSMSRERLAYVFIALLPPIPEEAAILDIGSRLGAVLYGAYMYTKSKRIIGVEMNPDLCQVQQTTINSFNLQDRIQIIHSDIQNQPDAVRAADVIILHNVFEFFMSQPLQARIWSFLRTNIKKGALIVTAPPLEDTFHHIDADLLGFRMDQWVRELPPNNIRVPTPMPFQTETAEVSVYQVL